MASREIQEQRHTFSRSEEQLVLDNGVELDLFDPCLDIDLGVEMPLFDAFQGATMTSTSHLQQQQPKSTTSAPSTTPLTNEISEEESLTSESDSLAVSSSSSKRNELQSEDDLIIVDIESLPKKPKRSLSAYNLFFKAERELLLKALPPREGKSPRKSHGKMGFAEMARNISSKWKQIAPQEKQHFDRLAKQDFARYEREMAEWRDQMKPFPAYMMTKQYQKKLKMNATLKQKKTPQKTAPKKKAPSAKKKTKVGRKTSVKKMGSSETMWDPPTLNSIVDSHLLAQEMESV